MLHLRPGGEIALHVEFFSKFVGCSGVFFDHRLIEYGMNCSVHHVRAYGGVLKSLYFRKVPILGSKAQCEITREKDMNF